VKKYIFVSLIVTLFRALSVATDSQHINDFSSSHIKKIENKSGWNRGIMMLDSGWIHDGLHLADSMLGIENSDYENQAAFEYTLLKLFLSAEKKPENYLLENKYILSSDSLDLSTFNCRISGSGSKEKNLPGFQYNFIFPVEKPYHLLFNGLNKNEPPHLDYRRNEQYQTLNSELADQMMTRNDSISCTIYIDFTKQIVSLHDYIYQFVNGVFDSITYKKDLEKFHTLSLRGYRQTWDKENGRFTAIVVFDRLFKDRKRGKKKVDIASVRFTLIVKSTNSVSEFAELKLQKILKML
jgi:hypothetical protein